MHWLRTKQNKSVCFKSVFSKFWFLFWFTGSVIINMILMRHALFSSVPSNIGAMPQDIYGKSKVTFCIPLKAIQVNVNSPDVKLVHIF